MDPRQLLPFDGSLLGGLSSAMFDPAAPGPATHTPLTQSAGGGPIGGPGHNFNYSEWVHTPPTVAHAVAGGNGMHQQLFHPHPHMQHHHQPPQRYSPYGMQGDEYDTRQMMDSVMLPTPPSQHLGSSSSSSSSVYAEYRPLPPIQHAYNPLSGSAAHQNGQSHSHQPLPPPASPAGMRYSPPQAQLQPHAQPQLQPQPASTRPIANKPRRSLAAPAMPPPATAPAGAASSSSKSLSAPRKSPRTPQQASEESSVPEAALHLLRLALPSGSNGSASTTTHGDDDASCDEDAEGESDATSVHSDDEARRKDRRTSVASSTTRGHRPARTQRELSTSTRAGSEGPTPARRTSGRVRRSRVEDPAALFGDDSDAAANSSGDDARGGDGDEEAYHDRRNGDRKPILGNKGKARASNASSAGGGTPASVASSSKGKRASLAGTADSPGSTSSSAPKKPRLSSASAAPRRPRRVAAPVTTGSRSFPAAVELHPAFPRLYRTFPLSSAFGPESYVNRLRSVSHDLNHASFPSAGDKLPEIGRQQHVTMMQPPEGAKWNKACDPFNLYAPRFTKGMADDKAGMCPVCVEPVARGGEGVERWLKLKNSSYVYHMSYAHGLSNLTGLPFSPPIKTRTQHLKPLTKDARDHMVEGLCHRCNNWIPLLSVKNVEAVVPELIWWKHAKPCHGNSSIQGEGDFYVEDAVYDLVVARKNAHQNALPPQPAPAHQVASHPVASGSHSHH